MPSTAHHSFTALCRAGKLKQALHILLTTLKPPENYRIYLQFLKSCILKNALSEGKNVHSFIAHRRFALAHITALHNRLAYLYAMCGCLEDARRVFDHMKIRDSLSWNTIVAAYGRHGYSHEAVFLFHQMQRTGYQPDQFTLANVLGACAKKGALKQGMGILHSINDGGILSNVRVATAMVDMHAKSGNIDKARELFDTMPQRNVVSWNAMIAGYLQNGFDEKALETFKQMQLAGVKPDSATFASILAACANTGDLEQGMDIHQIIKDRGLKSDVRVATALVNMYAKCGRIARARELFENMPQRNVVSWTAMIAGYVLNGFVPLARRVFKKMQLAGVKPNVVSWSAMIVGYAQKGSVRRASRTLKRMQLAGIKADSTIFASIVNACAKKGVLKKGIAKRGVLKQGMEIHQRIKDGGILQDVRVATALVDMYAKCGKIDKARKLFDAMPQRNVVSWTAMISGYARNGLVEKALETLKQMQLAGVNPNSKTFSSILTACAKMRALKQGMNIHRSIMVEGFLSDVAVVTALVYLYAKCARIDKARELFEQMPHRNVVSWNVMIAGYAQNGFVENALETFKQMQLAVVEPNTTTFANILPACAKMGDLEQGTGIHRSIMDRGLLSDVRVATALVNMYGQCGRIDKARELFDKMPRRNARSWHAMIVGYAQNGFIEKASEIFKQMQLAGVKPKLTLIVTILPACLKMGALK